MSDDDLSIIMQARKTLFSEDTTLWNKKSDDEGFHVSISCFHGAEICELVGAYKQNELTNIMNKANVGLYRGDGLGIFENVSRPEIEKKKNDR